VAVGEIRRTFLPSRIFGIVFSWGSVGFGNPFCSTSLRTGFTSKSKTFSETTSLKAGYASDDDVETYRVANSKNVLELDEENAWETHFHDNVSAKMAPFSGYGFPEH
jgi:hypothetical protein